MPYILTGTVFDTDGTTALSNVRVVARNERTNKTISTNSVSDGTYALDAANFENSYVNGDLITLLVIYTNSEDSLEHTIDTSAGGATGLNFTLENVPASDELRYMTVQDFYDFHHLTPSGEGVPSTKEVVKIGVQVEKEIDETIGTRFSDGKIEEDVNDADATTNWSGSTDAVAVAVTTDDADYKTRTGALDLGKSGTTEAFFTYTNSSVTSRDFRNKYVGFFVYLSSLTGLRLTDNGSAIQVRYGSSSANYYQKTWYYLDLVAGWNFLYFKSDDDEVTETGVVNDADMTYFQIRFDTAAASTTVTAGNFILDNIFLAHKDHLKDEYLDTVDARQWDYYLKNYPVKRMLWFIINRADENEAIVWDELTEIDNEIKISHETGRVRLVDLTTALAEGRNIFPKPGVKQVRAIYLYGKEFVPKEIRKLTILMTMRDLMHSAVSKALMRGQDSFRSEHFTVLDASIERIFSRYRHLDMLNV